MWAVQLVNEEGKYQYAKSKKAIRERVASAPHEVLLTDTSMLSMGSITANNIASGVSLAFVGPDPYKKRDFYGNIKLDKGKLQVT